MSISNNLKLAAAFIVGLILMACVNSTQPSNKVKREVVVYSKCSSVEASSDILYSINEIKDQLKKKSISVREDSAKKLCGYLLVNGTKTKTITGALTDLELLQEIDKFFK